MSHAQRGQTLVVFTIVTAFILLAVMALVGNSQVLFVNADRADAAALLAAQAGASAINQSELYNNNVVLDPTTAMSRCAAAAASTPFVVSVNCTVVNNVVTCEIVESVQMPIPLWSGAETVRAKRTARPAFGGTKGGF
jgi:hypothetical protein